MTTQMVELTHSTWKTELGSPVKIYVRMDHIFALVYMPENKCVAVQSIAGAYQTVQESEEEIINKMNETSNPNTTEEVK